MEKIIEVDILDKCDLLEKYNHKKVSRDLINYIIEEAFLVDRKDKMKIVINNHLLDFKCSDFITTGLKDEYNRCLKKHLQDNLLEIIYLIIGIAILFIWTLVKDVVFSEVILIAGWVLVWATVELEIFSDVASRKKKRVIKKLLGCQIIEVVGDDNEGNNI